MHADSALRRKKGIRSPQPSSLALKNICCFIYFTPVSMGIGINQTSCQTALLLIHTSIQLSPLSSRLLAVPQRVLTIKKHRLHISSLQQHLFPYFRKESLFSLKAGSADSGILISDFDLPASKVFFCSECASAIRQ